MQLTHAYITDGLNMYSRVHFREGGVLPEKLGGGVRPASQNPYPIYDQNLRYSVPFLWPDKNFETLFMTRPLHHAKSCFRPAF